MSRSLKQLARLRNKPPKSKQNSLAKKEGFFAYKLIFGLKLEMICKKLYGRIECDRVHKDS